MPDPYDDIANELRGIATERGEDPNDVGRLTRIAAHYAKSANKQTFDIRRMNESLFRAAGKQVGSNYADSEIVAPMLMPLAKGAAQARNAVQTFADATVGQSAAVIGEATGLMPTGSADALRGIAQQRNRELNQAIDVVPNSGIVGDIAQGVMSGGLPQVVQNEQNQRLADAGVDITTARNRLATGANSLVGGAAMALTPAIGGTLAKAATPIVGRIGGAAVGLAGVGAVGAAPVAASDVIARGMTGMSESDAERQTWEQSIPGAADYIMGAASMVPFGAGAVAQGVRDGVKFKTVNLDRQPLIPRVDRGADPAPGLGNSVVPKDVADAQLADLRASQSAADALNTGLPEIDTNLDAPIVGGPDAVVRKTPLPVAVTPTENAVDVMLRNQERLAAADARAADLGVNSDVNAATSARNRQLLDELGLSDPSVQNGSIPDITPIDKIGNIDPDRMIAPVLSDVQANLAKQRGLDVTARQAGREKDARVSAAEDVRAAETSARAVAQNTDTAKKNAVQSTVDEMRQAKLFADKNAREAKQAKVDENIDRIRREREIADADAIARERQRALDERNIIRQEIESGTRPSDEATAQLTANADNIIGSTRKSALDSPVSKSVAPEVQDVADMLDAGVQMRDIVNDFNAAGVPASQHIPIIRQAQEVLRNKKVASASTGGMNFPEPIRKAPNPPKVNDVVPASEMLTMEPRSLDEAPPVAKPVEQPIQQTTSVDQPVSGVNPPVEPTPVTTPKVVESPVDTKPVVTTEPPVQRTQTPKVEDPKIAARREKLKAEQDAKKAREEKLAAERTEVAPEPIPGEAPVEKAPTAEAEGWKVYKDPVTGKTKTTAGEIPEGAKEMKRPKDPEMAAKYDKIIERAKNESTTKLRDPNSIRSGATNIPSMIADAASDAAKKIVPTLKKIVSTISNAGGATTRFLYADSKSNLDAKSASKLREIEEAAFGFMDRNRAELNAAHDTTSLAFFDGGTTKELRAATSVPNGTMGNSYRAPFIEMVEGKIPATGKLAPLVEAVRSVNRITRQWAQSAGLDITKGAKNGEVMIYRWMPDMVRRLRDARQGDAFAKRFYDEVARRNGVSADEVRNHFESDIIVGKKNDIERLNRLDPQELARKYRDLPTHIKDTDGNWIQVLDLDPNNYVNAISNLTAKRAAAKSAMPDGASNFADINKLESGDKEALQRAIADFYDLDVPGSRADVADYKLFDAASAMTRMYWNLKLTLTHIGNAADISSLSMFVPPKYMLDIAKNKYEVGAGGLSAGRKGNTVDVSSDGRLRDTAAKLNKALRLTGSEAIPDATVRAAYSSIKSFYTDTNGKPSATTEHFMVMADLSESIKSKFRNGTATASDVEVATTKAIRSMLGRDLVGSQKAGMEHLWWARVLGPNFRAYGAKTLRLVDRTFRQSYKALTDKSIPSAERAYLVTAPFASLLASQSLNATTYLALKAAMAGSLGVLIDSVIDRMKNPTPESVGYLIAQWLGGGPASTAVQETTNRTNLGLTDGLALISSPVAAVAGLYKDWKRSDDVGELVANIAPVIGRTIKSFNGEGKYDYARNEFYRLTNEIEDRTPPSGTKETLMTELKRKLRREVVSDGNWRKTLGDMEKIELDRNKLKATIKSMKLVSNYEDSLIKKADRGDGEANRKLIDFRRRMPGDTIQTLRKIDDKLERVSMMVQSQQ